MTQTVIRCISFPLVQLERQPIKGYGARIHFRKRYKYRKELIKAQELIQEQGLTRESIPQALLALRAPTRTGLAIDPAWLALRDALLECAMAHGYIVGVATARVYSHTRGKQWSVEAVAQCYDRIIRYPIGGAVADVGPIPHLNQSILMTRGLDSQDSSRRWEFHWIPQGQTDRENRPYLPIPWWFHEDPVFVD